MIYLVQPSLRMQWVSLSESLIFDALKAGQIDADRIPWEPSDHVVDSNIVQLALRYGYPCSTGIMVAATIVAKWDHPKKIADSFRDLTKAQAALVANDQLMERRMPGWIEAGMRINEDVNASVEKSLREAREAAERLLEAPVQTDLLRHWSALGGPGE